MADAGHMMQSTV